MERAVPMTVLRALSNESVFRSASFWAAMSRAWSIVREPAVSRPGFWEAILRPRVFLIMAETGGSLVMKVNDRSS